MLPCCPLHSVSLSIIQTASVRISPHFSFCLFGVPSTGGFHIPQDVGEYIANVDWVYLFFSKTFDIYAIGLFSGHIYAQQITKKPNEREGHSVEEIWLNQGDWGSSGGFLGLGRMGSTQCLTYRRFSFSTFSLSAPSLSPFCVKDWKKINRSHWLGSSILTLFLSD